MLKRSVEVNSVWTTSSRRYLAKGFERCLHFRVDDEGVALVDDLAQDWREDEERQDKKHEDLHSF